LVVVILKDLTDFDEIIYRQTSPNFKNKKLHNEKVHNLYSSPIIIKMIKSRRMRFAVHVARIGEKRNAYRI
jgi:hypothetical protein